MPEGRLASLDEHGWRAFIHPAAVKGYFQTRRVWVQWFLIVIFLLAPWLRLGGHQLILMDIPQRRFAFFGFTFWAHDAPMLVMVLLAVTIGVILFTSLLGRIWCGWGCPQTVFIERVFRQIETWVEGEHLARRKLDLAEWSISKFQKRAAKWILFAAAALVITHSFLAYFVGSDRLIEMISGSPSENPTPFLFVMAATGILLLDFGWFREQFCVIMCPYGRFQSVLLDSDSVNVVYDPQRGEPRRGVAPSKEEEGDCVDCFRCVQACPTGIDIRNGTQLECIACTACIDACDDVMSRLKKSKGLVRYDSLQGTFGKKTRWVRPRTVAYTAVWLGVLGVFAYILTHRKMVDIALLRAKDTPYQSVPAADGSVLVINHFRLDISNKSFDETVVRLGLGAKSIERGFELVGQNKEVAIPAGDHRRVDFFLRFPVGALEQGGATATVLTYAGGAFKEDQHLVKVVGPFKSKD